MELPRIASHTSIPPTNIELLNYNSGSLSDDSTSLLRSSQRTTPSGRRPLSSCITEYNGTTATAASAPTAPPAANSQNTFIQPTITVPSGVGAAFQPSRKREEACALQNLKKRVQQLRVLKANQQEPVEFNLNGRDRENNTADLDNRPQLFQKILSNRPVSMVLDSTDLRTAWQDSDFITDCLCWHNVYRQRHCAPPLTMSTQLCHYAQSWANHLAHTNTFYYRNDKNVGQNLYCRPSNALQTDLSGQEVASYWYMAVKQYDFIKEPDVLHANVNAGHFTQLVWIKSRHFGVGKARSRSGKVIVVANYSPTGNISGMFQDNVLPPLPEYPSVPPPPTFRTYSNETTDTESTTSDSTNTSTRWH